jgi:hypothetical protein
MKKFTTEITECTEEKYDYCKINKNLCALCVLCGKNVFSRETLL